MDVNYNSCDHNNIVTVMTAVDDQMLQLQVPRSGLCNSRLLSTMLDSTKTDHIPLTQFNGRAVVHYLNYSNVNSADTDNSTDTNTIVDNDTLIGCLQLCHLLEDDCYFEHLLSLLHHRWWSKELQAKLNNLCSRDLQQEVFLHTPLQLLPDSLMIDDKFIKSWISVNCDKVFTINGDIYSCRVRYFDHHSSRSYHDRRVESLDLLLNDRLHGVYIQWYENGKRHWFKHYQHGLENGLVVEYYPDHSDSGNSPISCRSMTYYCDGQEVTVWRLDPAWRLSVAT